MIFKTRGIPGLTAEASAALILQSADFRISGFPMFADELNLNTFISKEYHTSLKSLCRRLIRSLTSATSADSQIIFFFKNPEDNTLAELITYGNGTVNGSDILKQAIGGS